VTTLAPDAAASPAPDDKRGFWRRRLIDPLRVQLTRGVTPDRLAFTVGLGTACSLFPFLGFTSLLNLGVGAALRLNHPILQTLNQVLGAVQLALILVYVRVGEWLWGANTGAFTLSEMLRVFREETLTAFFQQFGWAGLHALTAWLVTSPLLVAAISFTLRPRFQRWARKGST
jgi:uncharacterized protein (DUF2062 family)